LSEGEATSALEGALQQAALLTVEGAERIQQFLSRLEALDRDVPPQIASELAAARALARAARTASLACVGTQLESLTDAALIEQILNRTSALEL